MADRQPHPKISGRADADAMLREAAAALNGGRPQDAERIAAAVIASDPRNIVALHIRGGALLTQGRAAEAIAPLEAAASGRHDAKIETLLALALRETGRLDEALAGLKRAAKRRPPHIPAFYEYGCLLSFLDRHEEAIAVFRDGLAIAPMMPDLWIQLGYAFLRRRGCADAKAAFVRALEISPAAPGALFGIAKAHQELGESDTAAGYFRRYLAVKPNDAAAWLNLGQCLLELEQRDAAYDCFRAIVRGDPRSYATVLLALAKSPRGRFWLKQSEAARFLHKTPSV